MSKISAKKIQTPKISWKLIDASGKPLGRLASSVSKILMGKDKADFSPHLLSGDFVVITNSDKIRLTGKKWTQKIYYKHSRFVGSLKEKKAKDIPTSELIKTAVKGMLPKNKLRPKVLKRLKVFKGIHHDYQDKKPEKINL